MNDIRKYVFSALDSLNIRFGASHSELKIDGGKIYFIEIGGRMGGDRIGSDLVFLSTGYDFVKAVIDFAVGNKLDTFTPPVRKHYAAIRYLFIYHLIHILSFFIIYIIFYHSELFINRILLRKIINEDSLMIRKDRKIVYFGEVIVGSFIDFMRKELEAPDFFIK